MLPPPSLAVKRAVIRVDRSKSAVRRRGAVAVRTANSWSGSHRPRSPSSTNAAKSRSTGARTVLLTLNANPSFFWPGTRSPRACS